MSNSYGVSTWRWNDVKYKLIKGLIAVCIVSVILVSGYFSLDYATKNSGDMTPMIQTLWSVAATVSLGSVALWQNVRYKKLSDEKDEKHKRLENERMRLLNLPYLNLNTILMNRVLLKDQEGDFKHPKDEPDTCLIDSDLVETIVVSHEGVHQSMNVTGIKREEQLFVISVRNTGNNSANNVRMTFSLHGKQYDGVSIV